MTFAKFCFKLTSPCRYYDELMRVVFKIPKLSDSNLYNICQVRRKDFKPRTCINIYLVSVIYYIGYWLCDAFIISCNTLKIALFKVFEPCLTYIKSLKLGIKIFVVCFLLSIVSFSYAGAEITEGYDENTEITIRGTVAEIMHGMKGPVILKLKTGTKTYNVVTAPRWYLSRNAITFSTGTALEIIGSRYFGRDGNLYVIARQIRDAETGSVIALRDSYCKPLWRGGHRMHDRHLP